MCSFPQQLVSSLGSSRQPRLGSRWQVGLTMTRGGTRAQSAQIPGPMFVEPHCSSPRPPWFKPLTARPPAEGPWACVASPVSAQIVFKPRILCVESRLPSFQGQLLISMGKDLCVETCLRKGGSLSKAGAPSLGLREPYLCSPIFMGRG